ncbi:TPA: hypothetical protein MFN52_000605 [Klebsiella quasipneumoniae subsp. similipneumoniae]|nr:hypothetical protein [Klebsiella quasipneumoniae subsp. similipneumoniae]
MHFTVHTVHLGYFSFYIRYLSGDELVKGEQSTLHLFSFCSFWLRPVRRYTGGIKSFSGFTVHTVHLYFLSRISKRYRVNIR